MKVGVLDHVLHVKGRLAIAAGTIGAVKDISEEIIAITEIWMSLAELLLAIGLLVQLHSLEKEQLKLK